MSSPLSLILHVLAVFLLLCSRPFHYLSVLRSQHVFFAQPTFSRSLSDACCLSPSCIIYLSLSRFLNSPTRFHFKLSPSLLRCHCLILLSPTRYYSRSLLLTVFFLASSLLRLFYLFTVNCTLYIYLFLSLTRWLPFTYSFSVFLSLSMFPLSHFLSLCLVFFCFTFSHSFCTLSISSTLTLCLPLLFSLLFFLTLFPSCYPSIFTLPLFLSRSHLLSHLSHSPNFTLLLTLTHYVFSSRTLSYALTHCLSLAHSLPVSHLLTDLLFLLLTFSRSYTLCMCVRKWTTESNHRIRERELKNRKKMRDIREKRTIETRWKENEIKKK